MNELALFAGAGGGILGGKLLGWRTVCAVEIDDYARRVLLARQADGCLEPFPIWDDVTTFDGYPWRGRVDVVSGGFPCQDISAAGNGKGLDGERSGLWAEFARIIGEVQPRFAWVENSPILTLRGLDRVCGDLVALGYDSQWGTFSACSVGAAHTRERMFILAHPVQVRQSNGLEPQTGFGDSRRVVAGSRGRVPEFSGLSRGTRDDPETMAVTGVCRTCDAVAGVVDRLAAIGNGQVPAVVRLAWETLSAGIPKMA